MCRSMTRSRPLYGPSFKTTVICIKFENNAHSLERSTPFDLSPFALNLSNYVRLGEVSKRLGLVNSSINEEEHKWQI